MSIEDHISADGVLDANAWTLAECGPAGYSPEPRNGVLDLGRRHLKLTETWRIGDGTPHGARPGVTILGAGYGGVSQSPDPDSVWAYGPTVLEWWGPPGQPMIEVVGSLGFIARDFTLWLDPQKQGDATSASCGIQFGGDVQSAVSPSSAVERVSIYGSATSNTAYGIWITGEGGRAQTDFVRIIGCQINRVGYPIYQDAQQSVETLVESSALTYWHTGLTLADGTLVMHASGLTTMPGASDEAIGVHHKFVGGPTGKGGQLLRVESVHLEAMRGTSIRVDPGYFESIFRNCSYSMQGQGLFQMLLSNANKAPTRIIGGTITSPGTARMAVIDDESGTVEISGLKPRKQTHGYLYRSGV